VPPSGYDASFRADDYIGGPIPLEMLSLRAGIGSKASPAPRGKVMRRSAMARRPTVAKIQQGVENEGWDRSTYIIFWSLWCLVLNANAYEEGGFIRK